MQDHTILFLCVRFLFFNTSNNICTPDRCHIRNLDDYESAVYGRDTNPINKVRLYKFPIRTFYRSSLSVKEDELFRNYLFSV